MPKQRVYTVTLKKTFSYPECVIDGKNTLKSLHRNASNDFLENIKRPEYNAEDLQFVLDKVEPYKVRLSRDTEEDRERFQGVAVGNMGLGYLIEVFASEDCAKKFGGPIDRDQSPDFFVGRNDSDDDDDEADSEETYLRSDIEEYMNDRINFYYNALKGKQI